MSRVVGGPPDRQYHHSIGNQTRGFADAKRLLPGYSAFHITSSSESIQNVSACLIVGLHSNVRYQRNFRRHFR